MPFVPTLSSVRHLLLPVNLMTVTQRMERRQGWFGFFGFRGSILRSAILSIFLPCGTKYSTQNREIDLA